MPFESDSTPPPPQTALLDQPSRPEPSNPAPNEGFWPVLRNSRFLVLWSGQVFSQLADKIYLVLMIAIVANRYQTEKISGWVAAIAIAFTLPAVLLGSLAGVYVDRWSKKGVLVATNLLRGALVLVLPLFLGIFQGKAGWLGLPTGFWLLLTVTFLVSTLTQFFAPAEQATIPLLVKRRHLLPANSLFTTTMLALLIVGFAIGEPLLTLADRLAATLGLPDVGKEFLVGGGYAIAGLLLLGLDTGEIADCCHREQPHPWEDIREGLAYLQKNLRVRNALIQLVILFSIFAALVVLAVSLAEVIPGIEPDQFGILLAAGGLGMGLSAAILGHWGGRWERSQLSLWGSLGMAASLVGLSLATAQLWLALLMTVLLGGSAALVGVPMQTTIQAETPPQLRGKVFGLQNNAVNIALSLPLAVAGVAETLLGLRTVFWGLAGLAVAGSLLNWYISPTGSVMSAPD